MDTDAAGQSRPEIRHKKSAAFIDYLSLARLDHSTKQIFVLPGLVFAYLLRGSEAKSLGTQIVLGMLTAICIASANYVINEYLDREFDRHHPTKSQRRAVQSEMNRSVIIIEWLVFITMGLGAAALASYSMFWIACVFALQGVIYNVPYSDERSTLSGCNIGIDQ